MTRSASTEWWSRDGRQQAVSAQGESLDCLLIGEKTMKTLITIIRSVVAPVGVAGRNLLSVQLMKTNFNLLQKRIFCAFRQQNVL